MSVQWMSNRQRIVPGYSTFFFVTDEMLTQREVLSILLLVNVMFYN